MLNWWLPGCGLKKYVEDKNSIHVSLNTLYTMKLTLNLSEGLDKQSF